MQFKQTCLLPVFLILCCLPACAQGDEDSRIKLEVSQGTTFFTEPLTEDGIVDYIAALNKHYGEGFDSEDNAFALIVHLFPEVEAGSYFEEIGYWDTLFKQMGLVRDPTLPRFVPWSEYARQQGLIAERSDEIFTEALERPWTREQYPDLHRWLEHNSDVAGQLEKALAREHYFSPLIADAEDVGLVGVLLPDLPEHRELAKMLVAKAFRSIGEGRHADAVRQAELLDLYSTHLAKSPMAISKLVGISLRTLEGSVIEALALDGGLKRDVAHAWLASRRTNGDLHSMKDVMDLAERSGTLDLIFRSYVGEVPLWSYITGDDDQAVNDQLDWNLSAIARHPLFDANQVTGGMNQQYDRLSEIAHMESAQQREAAFELFDESLREGISDEDMQVLIVMALNPDRDLPEGWTAKRYNLSAVAAYSKILLPALGVAVRIEHRSNVRRLVESTAIALLGYRDQHGELPDSLDVLVPTYFESVPVDPYTETPLVYRINADGSALVYSFGENLKDDGGVDGRRDQDIAIQIGVPKS